MERAMGIEPNAEAWEALEALNIPIPFSSQGHTLFQMPREQKYRG